MPLHCELMMPTTVIRAHSLRHFACDIMYVYVLRSTVSLLKVEYALYTCTVENKITKLCQASVA
jgi:hypothetical protein